VSDWEELRWVDDSGLQSPQFVYGDNPASTKLAKDLLNDLCLKYGNYSWGVRVFGGVVHVCEMSAATTSVKWGMARRLLASDFSASNLKKDVLMSAGEWLERGNLPRKTIKYEQDDQYRVEGIPEKDQVRPSIEVARA
jgi:hypothetical protein